jgi:hypothetical protein
MFRLFLKDILMINTEIVGRKREEGNKSKIVCAGSHKDISLKKM